MSGFGNFLIIDGAREGGQQGQQEMILGMQLNMLEQQAAAAETERARQAEEARQLELERQRLEAERQRQAEIERQQKYQGFMTGGVQFVQSGQFDHAIQQFAAALQLQPNDVMARYNIACCTESLGNYAGAYKLFLDLQSHANQLQDLPLHIANCDIALYQSGNASLKTAKSLYDENKAAESAQALNQARTCITSSDNGKKLAAKIEDFANLVAWDEHSEHINKQFKIADEKLKQQEYRVAAHLFSECSEEYTRYAKYLNDAEVEFKRQTEVLLPVAKRHVQLLDNLAYQNHINSKLESIQNAIDIYDTASAIELLKEVVGICGKINPITDAIDAGYIPLEILNESLNKVQTFKKEYETRKNSNANLAATNIVTAVMDSNKLSNYEKDKLQTDISTILQNQWLSLDRRNLDELNANLVSIVQSGLEHYNQIMACCYGANFYIADEKTLHDQIAKYIEQHLPNDYRVPITLPMFMQRAQEQRMPAMLLGSMELQGAQQYPIAQVIASPVLKAQEAEDLQKGVHKMDSLTL